MNQLKAIYEPQGAAREYAELSLNIYRGCTHGCIYCYNDRWPNQKGEFFKAARPRVGLLKKVVHDCQILKEHYGANNCPEIHLTFLGDAYQPAEKTMGLTRIIVRTIKAFGLPFTILTKSAAIVRDLDILASHPGFRLGMSFTSVDQDEVNRWELGTGYVMYRLDALREFRNRGVKIWISLEPLMRVESTIKVINAIGRFADHYWIGALNHMDPPEPIDLVDAQRRIMQVLDFKKLNYSFKSSFTDI